MLFSIIIPTFNRPVSLENCLNSLLPAVQQIERSECEIIVTDDSHDWTTSSLIKNKFAEVKWVAGPQKGPAVNRNNGAAQATGKWLIFIDDDCIPGIQLISAYQTAISQYQDSRVFEGRISAAGVRTRMDEEAPINETGGYLWSCNFMIERTFFVNVLHGFDEQFPYAAMEDVELHYRIKQMKEPIPFVPDARVVHPWRIQKHLLQSSLKHFYSTKYFLKKHPEQRKELTAFYFVRAFYNSFFKCTLPNAFRYRFRGFRVRVCNDFLQLYFAVVIAFMPLKKNNK